MLMSPDAVKIKEYKTAKPEQAEADAATPIEGEEPAPAEAP